MRLIAIDPGLSTGIAECYLDENVPLEVEETTVIDGGCEGFIDWWHTSFSTFYTSAIYVCERFVIDGTITGVWSPQIEGALKALARPEDKLYWQLRSDKATLFNQKLKGDAGQTERFNWLRERGFRGEAHELDVITHALVWAKRQNHVPTLKKYWKS